MSDHIKEIASVLIQRGFTPVAAAGIIGNAKQESGWNPASVGDGGGGLWGFTSGAISLGSLQSYAHAHGADWTNAKVQANFLADHVDGHTKMVLNSVKSPAAAAQYFMENWERPYVPTENLARRQDGAVEAYHQISGGNLGTAKTKAGGNSDSTKSVGPSSSATTTGSAITPQQLVLQALTAQSATPAATTAADPDVSPVVTHIPTLTKVV